MSMCRPSTALITTALGNQLALAQRFIGLAFTRGGVPRQVAVALLVTLLVQVFHPLESDAPPLSSVRSLPLLSFAT